MTNSGLYQLGAMCANWAETGDVEIIGRYLRERTAPVGQGNLFAATVEGEF